MVVECCYLGLLMLISTTLWYVTCGHHVTGVNEYLHSGVFKYFEEILHSGVFSYFKEKFAQWGIQGWIARRNCIWKKWTFSDNGVY